MDGSFALFCDVFLFLFSPGDNARGGSIAAPRGFPARAELSQVLVEGGGMDNLAVRDCWWCVVEERCLAGLERTWDDAGDQEATFVTRDSCTAKSRGSCLRVILMIFHARRSALLQLTLPKIEGLLQDFETENDDCRGVTDFPRVKPNQTNERKFNVWEPTTSKHKSN